MNNEQLVEVMFDLPRDSAEWPPMAREGLWAAQVTADSVRLRNVPCFARNVSYGDLVRVRWGETGEWLAGECIEWSGHCTIRVFPLPDGLLGGSLERVSEMFAALGIGGEGSTEYGVLAFDVPPHADLVAIQRLLQDGVREDWWDYEEACVGNAWIAAEASASGGDE